MAPNGGRVIEIMVAEGLGFFSDRSRSHLYDGHQLLCRNGGDGYKMSCAGLNAYDYGSGLEVVLAEYMAVQGSMRHS